MLTIKKIWRIVNIAILLPALFTPWLQQCSYSPHIQGKDTLSGFDFMTTALLDQLMLGAAMMMSGLGLIIWMPVMVAFGIVVYVGLSVLYLLGEAPNRIWLAVMPPLLIAGGFISSIFVQFSYLRWGAWVTGIGLLSSFLLEVGEPENHIGAQPKQI